MPLLLRHVAPRETDEMIELQRGALASVLPESRF
jgi:hypothetical protein